MSSEADSLLDEERAKARKEPEAVPAEDRDRVDKHWLSILRRVVEVGGFSEESLARVVVMYDGQRWRSDTTKYEIELKRSS